MEMKTYELVKSTFGLKGGEVVDVELNTEAARINCTPVTFRCIWRWDFHGIDAMHSSVTFDRVPIEEIKTRCTIGIDEIVSIYLHEYDGTDGDKSPSGIEKSLPVADRE